MATSTTATDVAHRKSALVTLPLALVVVAGALGFIYFMLGRVSGLFDQAREGQVQRIGHEGLPFVEGPVVVIRSAGKATVVGVLHPMAGIQAGGNPAQDRTVRITVPVESLEVTNTLLLGAHYGRTTEVDVTDATTGEPVTMDNLGARGEVVASKVRIVGRAAYSDL